ncbi:methyl-accepting chemotaxis protein [Pelagibacterium sediminicola]|uniref:methyl-accepting chemotaxis protein n=1 Tax=Pelagibacterium sediminicola TaxID=2248761 RepID=UPI000E31A48C|nr:methyl-accepting chemotaxis protein [Pelagibacterium sediminicola]
MFRRGGGRGACSDALAKVDAIDRSQAVIELTVDGLIVDANENFLNVMGYRLDEIVGQHHRIFVDPEYGQSEAYRRFWQSLAAGDFQADEFRRFAKGGREIWIQASYNPVFDKAGKPVAVIKFATDITAQKLRAADHAAQIAAIGRVQAVISFSLEGEVLDANENFLDTLGYGLDEIKGRHHAMFCDSDYAASKAYEQFWGELRRGEFVAGEFRRVGKGGKEVWIQASYNPILDPQGRPVKVVKFATDITERKRAEAIIEHLTASLERMAGGDLSGRVEETFTGRYEQLRQAYNLTLEKLVGIVSRLKDTSHTVKTATSELLSGANDLSERTTRQAATIEETSASMEQLSGAVVASSDDARNAAENARMLSGSAREGGAVMSQANEAMQQISASSAKISNIIGMIDDIAFQTNLLALNASVEAARAGEAGKGFAVVAIEVRRLAQSAADASAEVKALIEASGAEVAGGRRLVEQAATRLAEILKGTEQSSELIEGIARSSAEQSAAIAEINVAVRQLDEMTQHNAALVEQTNAAVEQTEGQALELDRIVEVFRLDGDTAPAEPAPPPPARRYLAQANAAIEAEWNDF